MTRLAAIAPVAALVLTLAACTTSGDLATSSTPPSEVTPTAEATSTPAPGSPLLATRSPAPTPVPILVFTSGEHTLEGIEFLVFSVPYRDTFPSDQFPDRLDRVYRGDDGQIHVDTIPFPKDPDGHPFVIFFNPIAVDPSGEALAAAICVRGECGGFIPASGDAITTIYRSSDRGVTWRRDAEVDGGVRVFGWSDGEFVLWRAAPDGGDPPSAIEQFWRHPSGTPFAAPANASTETPRPSHFDSPYGTLWWGDDGLLDVSGVTVVPFPSAISQFARAEFLPDGTTFWAWLPADADPGGQRLAAVFDRAGIQLTPTLEVPYGCCAATPDGRLLVPEVTPLPQWVNAYRDELPEMQDGAPYGRAIPGFLDPQTGAIEAITDPFLRAIYQDRDQIRVIAIIPTSPEQTANLTP